MHLFKVNDMQNNEKRGLSYMQHLLHLEVSSFFHKNEISPYMWDVVVMKISLLISYNYSKLFVFKINSDQTKRWGFQSLV
jgi:hypothetical protein